MTLPATIDNLDAVPPELRAHYMATEDGRFRLDAEGVEDVAGLKSALEKERAARKALKAELDALAAPADDGLAETGTSGIEIDENDPGEPVRITPTGDTVSGEDVEAEGEASELSEAISEPGSELDPAATSEAAAVLRRQLETRLIEAEATAAIIAAAGVPELLLPVMLPRLGVRELDGAFQVQVLGPVDGDEVPESLAELVDALRRSEIYGRAFAGTGKSGSGAPADSAGGGRTTSLAAGDPLALGRHLRDIAAGRITVEG